MANGYICYGDDKKYVLSLDRIKCFGNYEPNNCRWVDCKIQANNKTNNHYITINGITKTMSEWSDCSGINYSTIRQRVNLGFTDDGILRPVKKIIIKHKENDFLTICGKTKTIKEWRKIYGIKYTTMKRRSEHGYTDKDLIREPHSGSSPKNKEVVK